MGGFAPSTDNSRVFGLEMTYSSTFIGVARGCSGCTCTPQGGEKKFLGLIYRKKCESAPPNSQSKSQFLGQFLLGGLDLEVYLDGL